MNTLYQTKEYLVYSYFRFFKILFLIKENWENPLFYWLCMWIASISERPVSKSYHWNTGRQFFLWFLVLLGSFYNEKNYQNKGITYFDTKFFPAFNNFMKYYHKPQNSMHFKNQLIDIYKMMGFYMFKNF